MIEDDTASIIPPDHTRRPKTGAERTRAWRERQKRLSAQAVAPDVLLDVIPVDLPVTPAVTLPVPADVTPGAPTAALPFKASVAPLTSAVALPVSTNVTPAAPEAASPFTTSVTALAPAALPVTANVTPLTHSHRHVKGGRLISSQGLTAAALALAGVGVAMNACFAWSQGSTDLAGSLFLAVGVAADLVALTAPLAAAQLWQARQRVRAAAAWLAWSITFVFAVTAGIGFASVNIADVTSLRASRVTPAVTTARDALRDAMTARDRECANGVGRICREREQRVIDSHRALDTALTAVEHAADPQSDAAIKIVAWLSVGRVKPTADDFAMARLALLALLPQIGGVLLMVGRARHQL